MKVILFSLLVIVLFCSLRCKPEKEEPKPDKPYDQRDQFVGVYSVVSDSGDVYQIQITKVDSADKKYIRILNYGNLFSQLLSDYSAIYLPLNYFSIGGGGVESKTNTIEVGI